MNNVYLALGSNLGDKEKNIEEALSRIENRIGPIIAKSAIYKTIPQGFVSDNLFANSACHLLTNLSLDELLIATQEIEINMGRAQKSAHSEYKDRVIDIDILLYNDDIVQSSALVLPHPQLHKRSFVLDPLMEIAANTRHPLLHKTIAELKAELDKENR